MESLAVKYRPKKLEDISGQSSTTHILLRQVELGQFKNCYLFYGPSGTGKTTSARILANLINKGVGEPIEIDGASNSGVENVRNIIKSAQERSIEGTYKIYIIDEVHALSNAAWQAFLKCIEEPPQYTIFMFCTTDIQKVPATILNRVQVFKLNKISTKDIEKRLEYICKQEHFTNYEQSIEYIAKIANGGMRDAISMLEKCASYSNDISIDNVMTSLGNYSYTTFFNLVNAIIDCDIAKIFNIIEQMYASGDDLKQFVDQYLNFCIDLSKYSIFKSPELTKIPGNMISDLENATNIENATGYYLHVIDKLLELKNMVKTDTNMKSTIEVMLLQIARGQF